MRCESEAFFMSISLDFCTPGRPRSADCVEKLGGSALSLRLEAFFQGLRADPLSRWRPCGRVFGGLCRHRLHWPLRWPQFGEPPQILRCRREQEFVLRAAWTTQPQASESQDAFQMREQHLDLLPKAAGDFIFRRCGKGPRHVAGVFIDIAWNFPRHRVGAASRFEIADVAILLAGAINARVVGSDAGARRGVGAPKLNQFLARRTCVAIPFGIEREVRARERAIRPRRMVKDWNMRRNLLLLDEPGQVLRCAIGGVGGQITGLEAEAI